MNEIDVNSLLVKMRALSEQVGTNETPAQDSGNFSELMKNGIDTVNKAQQDAGKLAEAFEMGDPNVDLAEVMVSLQKAGLSFRAMTEVRNRLVSAYQDIMNMPI
ncbi:MAG: flagellar hook-basal body complex protein FliE [Pseudomonadota bacterium]